ncbi:TetR/AcrR family transcriptional regulator [Nocardioides sp. WS12]|uniref:TetR/AcrR family transcriptional regulator n=1 Tax=Nocardioides sp. WS12 TaxID=2486272 RepID=UPI0015F807D3|nr:TetR/AcrR family transcriptional regulator [Nocardioides sp. WS12]
MSTTPVALPRKLNRRGVAARERLLSTALEMLGTGRPESVSINLVAREAGLSWGSVQNLFGDSDGFWSAVVEQIRDDRPALWSAPESDTVAGRVTELADLWRRVLDSPYAVAIETLRSGLPRPRPTLALSHPLTAAAMSELENSWTGAFVDFFDGMPGVSINEQRAIDVAHTLTIALHGLRSHVSNGTGLDSERVYKTLVTSLTSYLEG